MNTSDGCGYQLIHVWCLHCGHSSTIDPERMTNSKKLRCQHCWKQDFEIRIIWHTNAPPDNVVQIKRLA